MIALVAFLSWPLPVNAQDNAIVVENAKPGTTSWILQNPRVTDSHPLWHTFGLRSPWIEGYCSEATVKAGDTVQIHVSTDPAVDFTLDLYRMGYYQGHGGRLVASYGPIAGKVQPTPEMGANRVTECDWESSLSITIPDDWLSGVYLGKLTELAQQRQSYVIFIVRDERPADLLFQCSDMTWQAYNRWPYNNSLYCTDKIDWHTAEGVDVSILRPYGKYTQLVNQPLSTGSGEYLMWEFPFAFWLEKEGYNVSYLSNWDVHYRPETLKRGKAYLSVGHDEYWTQPMYDAVRAAVADGMHAAFFSANTAFGKLRLKPGRTGRPDIVFERDGRFDPREDALMGNRSAPPVVGGGDWVCSLPDHWIFAGTGMKKGDAIPGLVGWEFHGLPADIPGLEVVSEGPTDGRRFPPKREEWETDGRYAATIYPGPKGNIVFSCATIWWADALSSPPGHLRSYHFRPREGPDPRVQQITHNILQRMLAQ
jgi:hypothetical protein